MCKPDDSVNNDDTGGEELYYTFISESTGIESLRAFFNMDVRE